MINKLTSEFNKFKFFGIDLNDAHKTTTKSKLTKQAEKIVKKVDKNYMISIKNNEIKLELPIAASFLPNR